MPNFSHKLIQTIKDQGVTIRPRWQSVLVGALWVSGTLVMLLATIGLLSFILFILARSGVWYAPQFGLSGVVLFITASPWLLMSLLGIFLLCLYILVTHFAFSYKKPLVYTLVGIVCIVVTLGSLAHMVGVHDRISTLAEQRDVPGLRAMYRLPADTRPEAIAVGVITSVANGSFEIKNEHGHTVTVMYDATTKIAPRVTLRPDEAVAVFGRPLPDSTLTAFGVRPAERLQLFRDRTEQARPKERW